MRSGRPSGAQPEAAHAFQICTCVPSKSDEADGLACHAVVIASISCANAASSSEVVEVVGAALTG